MSSRRDFRAAPTACRRPRAMKRAANRAVMAYSKRPARSAATGDRRSRGRLSDPPIPPTPFPPLRVRRGSPTAMPVRVSECRFSISQGGLDVARDVNTLARALQATHCLTGSSQVPRHAATSLRCSPAIRWAALNGLRRRERRAVASDVPGGGRRSRRSCFAKGRGGKGGVVLDRRPHVHAIGRADHQATAGRMRVVRELGRLLETQGAVSKSRCSRSLRGMRRADPEWQARFLPLF
jgi:hypothetical protein